MRPNIKFALSVRCDYDNQAVRKIYAATFTEIFPENFTLDTGEIVFTPYDLPFFFKQEAEEARLAGNDQHADFLLGILILQDSVRACREKFADVEIKLYEEEPIVTIGKAPAYDAKDFNKQFPKTLNERYRTACRNPNLLDDEVEGLKNPGPHLGLLSYIKSLKTPAYKFDTPSATSDM